MKTNEHLALLYVQSRDLTELSPGDLLVMYRDALERVNAKEEELYRLNSEQMERPAQYGDYIS